MSVVKVLTFSVSGFEFSSIWCKSTLFGQRATNEPSYLVYNAQIYMSFGSHLLLGGLFWYRVVSKYSVGSSYRFKMQKFSLQTPFKIRIWVKFMLIVHIWGFLWFQFCPLRANFRALRVHSMGQAVSQMTKTMPTNFLSPGKLEKRLKIWVQRQKKLI